MRTRHEPAAGQCGDAPLKVRGVERQYHVHHREAGTEDQRLVDVTQPAC